VVAGQYWWNLLIDLGSMLEEQHIDYIVLDEAALTLQGIGRRVPATLDIAVQWDRFGDVYKLCQRYRPGTLQHQEGQEHFSFVQQGFTVHMKCYMNTVVLTDPDRLLIEYDGLHLPVKALDYYLRILPSTDPLYLAIKQHLSTLQKRNSQQNAQAWSESTYQSWIARFGTPVVAAAHLKKNPRVRLGNLTTHLTGQPPGPLPSSPLPLQGKQIINLLGSHGAKAIAMALLGAQVTVVDISQENERYASEVAAAAGVKIRYLVNDVLGLPDEELNASYDVVLMELGILHYFVDLEPLFRVVERLLRSGGRLILQDFHPITTKLISSRGKRHKVSGNYFDKAIISTNVAHSKHLSADDPQQVYLRQWTLGEVVSAVAKRELRICLLEESPNSKIDDIGLPKLFTLVAERI
jgi:2-polyprenyl-3-methyl-5-hydroxy-6-metoxy-1,4-benzoquinol methylase